METPMTVTSHRLSCLLRHSLSWSIIHGVAWHRMGFAQELLTTHFILFLEKLKSNNSHFNKDLDSSGQMLIKLMNHSSQQQGKFYNFHVLLHPNNILCMNNVQESGHCSPRPRPRRLDKCVFSDKNTPSCSQVLLGFPVITHTALLNS